jgi:hypothetical protein
VFVKQWVTLLYCFLISCSTQGTRRQKIQN